MQKKITGALLSSILICGCSTTATISRSNGREVEAKVLRSTSGAVMVMSDGGSEISIPRSEITDIDHPGNAAAVVGGLLGIYGGINIAAGASMCDDNGGAYCTGVFLPAAIGVPMLIWGLTTWMSSSSAATASSSSRTVPEAPTASAFDFAPSSNGGRASVLQAR